eukprot:1630774-Alexandrium_andersonii.AAC.1
MSVISVAMALGRRNGCGPKYAIPSLALRGERARGITGHCFPSAREGNRCLLLQLQARCHAH